MQKQILSPSAAPGSTASPADARWLDLPNLATVRLTSEDPDHPIEAALDPKGPTGGWRAGAPGEQIIHLQFAAPQRLRTIVLRFDVAEARTQEFSLEWSSDGGRSFRSVVRQSYNFTPGGATCEEERYAVELDGVTDLRLTIRPDVSGGPSHATLTTWRLA